jgi:hypothetical protein
LIDLIANQDALSQSFELFTPQDGIEAALPNSAVGKIDPLAAR